MIPLGDIQRHPNYNPYIDPDNSLYDRESDADFSVREEDYEDEEEDQTEDYHTTRENYHEALKNQRRVEEQKQISARAERFNKRK